MNEAPTNGRRHRSGGLDGASVTHKAPSHGHRARQVSRQAHWNRTTKPIDRTERSLVVQGIRLFVTPSTDCDDGLRGFDDLKVGQKVEVDFRYRDGRHFATEVELEG